MHFLGFPDVCDKAPVPAHAPLSPVEAPAKRFRVAISFPGTRRGPFAFPVAGRLAARCGQKRILYDKYHAAEFATPNLATYLPRLYLSESELVIVALCKEYDQSEWRGLEWRHVLELIRNKEDDRLMLVRLDDVDIARIPDLVSGDGCLDVWGDKLSIDDGVDAIEQRLAELDRASAP